MILKRIFTAESSTYFECISCKIIFGLNKCILCGDKYWSELVVESKLVTFIILQTSMNSVKLLKFDRKLAENRKFRPIFFGSKLAEMKILLFKWHMAIKTYFINLFHLFLKNLTSQSKFLEKRRFCEFIPLDMYERFSFYHFWMP